MARVWLEREFPNSRRCWIRALNVRFIFGLRNGRVQQVARPYKPEVEARRHDPAACEVPDVIYDEVVALAAKTLRPQQSGQEVKPTLGPPYRNGHHRNGFYHRHRHRPF